jgi:hypothetical protein
MSNPRPASKQVYAKPMTARIGVAISVDAIGMRRNSAIPAVARNSTAQAA